MPPRRGSHCSRNSRWLTCRASSPAATPARRADPAWARTSAPAPPARPGRAPARRRAARARGRRGRVRAGAVAGVAPVAGRRLRLRGDRAEQRDRQRRARAIAARSGAFGVGGSWHRVGFSLRPRERQVEQQVLRLQLAAATRRPSPCRGRPAGRRAPDACPPVRRTPAGTGTAAAPGARRRPERHCRGRSAARSPRHRVRRATTSARRRSRATARSRPRRARKCRTQRSSTRHSAASAGWPRLRLTARSKRSLRSQYDRGVAGVEHVEVDRATRHPVPREQLADRAERLAARVQLDRRVVGRHHRAVLEHADLLRPEQHLGGARLERIGVGAEDVAQQHLGQLVHEAAAATSTPSPLEQPDVRRLDRRRAEQSLAKAQPHARSSRVRRRRRARRARPRGTMRRGSRSSDSCSASSAASDSGTGASSGRSRCARRKSSRSVRRPSAPTVSRR